MAHEHLDVLIVGAGISGIGAAYHLQKRSPGRSFAIVDGRENIGGTWDFFRYPGIRSDSDMYTFGFNFKPWKNPKAIADAPSILAYLGEAVKEFNIEDKIRFRHKVKSAAWSTESAAWTVELVRGEAEETTTITCNFLFLCGGYYKYDGGYTPDFEGMDSFKGPIVHPQKWTDDVDYKDKRVVVIGSGATAVTLIPSMAQDTAHITMLQRSPTYMGSRPAEDKIANWLREHLPAKLAYGMTRWKNVTLGKYFYDKSQKQPEKVKAFLIDRVKEQLEPGYDVETHFTPSYNPWDERLCLVPDGDLFQAINDGKASVVTDHIDRFTQKGILLKSGKELEADLIVTATGLNLEAFNGIDLKVDGKQIQAPDVMSYKGVMFSDVPNLALTMGYTNASWTLKADLTSSYIARLLNHMDKSGVQISTPRRNDPSVTEEPWVDFFPGYFQRSMHLLPKQGSKRPWKLYQNYFLDKLTLGFGKVDDGILEFSNPHAVTVEEEVPIAAE